MTIRQTHQTPASLGAMQEYQRACRFAALAIGREQQLTFEALLITLQHACWPWLVSMAPPDHGNNPPEAKASDPD